MQNHTTMQELITWLQPQRTRHVSEADVWVAIRLRSEERKNTTKEINLRLLFHRCELTWKYVKVGKLGDHLILAEGAEGDYFVNDNHTIVNAALCDEIFAFFKQSAPRKAGESARLELQAEPIAKGFYKLKKG